MKNRLSVIHKNRKDLSEASRQTNIKFASIQRCAAGKQMHTLTTPTVKTVGFLGQAYRNRLP